jgi:hypothetical protein
MYQKFNQEIEFVANKDIWDYVFELILQSNLMVPCHVIRNTLTQLKLFAFVSGYYPYTDQCIKMTFQILQRFYCVIGEENKLSKFSLSPVTVFTVEIPCRQT